MTTEKSGMNRISVQRLRDRWIYIDLAMDNGDKFTGFTPYYQFDKLFREGIEKERAWTLTLLIGYESKSVIQNVLFNTKKLSTVTYYRRGNPIFEDQAEYISSLESSKQFDEADSMQEYTVRN